MKKRGIILSLVMAAMLSASCYGSFNLTKKIYTWNGGQSNKFVKSAVMWALFIIPVYEIAGVADLFIFNTLEFWTGSNPMAMKEGDSETLVMQHHGHDYYVTARKDRFDMCTINGDGETISGSLVFDHDAGLCYALGSGVGKVPVGRFDPAHPELLSLLDRDGQVVRVVDLME